MAAVAINGTSQPPKNLLLRVLDTLAEWLIQQELRIISRRGPFCGSDDR